MRVLQPAVLRVIVLFSFFSFWWNRQVPVIFKSFLAFARLISVYGES
jgi:flagellar biosynthesis protein FliR